MVISRFIGSGGNSCRDSRILLLVNMMPLFVFSLIMDVVGDMLCYVIM